MKQYRYEINPQNFQTWNKPESGPLTIKVTNFAGRSKFQDKSEAIKLVKEQKELYPNMDFIVLSVKGSESSVTFDTSK